MNGLIRSVLAFILLFLVFIVAGQAQFSVDAGPDIIFCSGTWDETPVPIDSVSIKGGVAPYFYKWSTLEFNVDTWDFVQISSQGIMDDTLSPNPKLLYFAYYKLVVEVTDSRGSTCTDTINVDVAGLYVWNFEFKYDLIKTGDSIQLRKGVSGGDPPLTYLWSPAEGLADPTDVNTYASPDTWTNYHLIITDAYGCVANDYYLIDVSDDPAGEDKLSESIDCAWVDSENAVIHLTNDHKPCDITRISIWNQSGQMVEEFNVHYRKQINYSKLPKGIYYVVLGSSVRERVLKVVR